MKSEFSADVVKLNHHAPEHFTQFVWEHDVRPTLKYAIFSRCMNYFFTAFVTTALVILLWHYEMYYLYFDFWAIILVSVAYVLPLGHFKKSYGHLETWEALDLPTKINWMFYSAALPTGVVGAISYWALLFKIYPDIFLMILNTLPIGVIMVTVFITSIPLRLLHFVFFAFFYLTYIFFSVGYQMSGRKGPKGTNYIYKELDWKNTATALLTSSLGFLIGMIAYVLFCLVSMAKLALKEKHEY